MSDDNLLERLWSEEARRILDTSRIMLSELANKGRIMIWNNLFNNIYPEFYNKLLPYRGWWNPTLSLATVLHFYPQVYLIIQECRYEDLLQDLGLDDDLLTWAIREGKVLALLSSPHISCDDILVYRIFNAQGKLPTILRFTETLKSILYNIKRREIYNTKNLYNELIQNYSDEEARDLATRVSDIAALGLKALAENLYSELMKSKNAMVLVRSLHHVLVEPVIDSMATIAAYSTVDTQFVRNISESNNPLFKILSDHIALLGAKAKVRIPNRLDADTLQKIAENPNISWAHEQIATLSLRLENLAESPEDALGEAASIARSVAKVVELANRRIELMHGLTRKVLVSLGLISQIPVTLLLPARNLLEAGITTLASAVVQVGSVSVLSRAIRRLYETVEEVYVVPAIPLIYQVQEKQY